MAEFSYIIRTEKGSRETGNISAENYNEALEKLQKDGTAVIKLTERDSSFDFIKPFLDRLSMSIEEMKNKVPLNVLVFFTRQLSTMFSAGLTIERALYFLSTEEKNKKFKKVLLKIADDVKKGLLLSNALERHPGVFSSLYISLVKAGEVSGKLSETLEELSIYLEKIEDTQRKVKSAMYYPVFIIVFLFVVITVMFTFLIPKFKNVYDQLGSELPYYTVLFVNMSVWFQNNFFNVMVMLFLGLISIWIFTLTDTGRLLKDRILLNVPIFGSIIKQNILSKFSKTFGILISSGVSVMDAMELVIRVVNNRVYEIAVKNATKSIENGVSISESLKITGVFPPIMIQLFSTGEETGEIDNLSLKASDFYTKQVNASVDRLTSLIEPLLIILVGIVIGGVIIVTYLPIFQVGAAIAN
ncbi:MAG: pilus assembly protein PilC [Candidatus Marinimicrobia bacterium]|nr:pilus assembly protein PilC [Candidatus Neomarinimicrobiota bacterium]|tara:strand:+ start:42742 stop:43983 length:1242 start_codon:yes stop_codon:yes gene_type:complete